MEKTLILARLQRLRTLMASELNVQAFLLPDTDPHGSEYLAEAWQFRQYFSGFTGSAGVLLVCANEAFLWTDSRYFLQAEAELQGTGINLMRMGTEGVPTLFDFLRHGLAGVDRMAVVSDTTSLEDFDNLKSATQAELVTVESTVLQRAWPDRPALPSNPLTIWPEALCGESARQKIERIFAADDLDFVQYVLLSDLSEIAWTLNLRGSDIAYNPLFFAYLLLHRDGTSTLFVQPNAVSPEVRDYLQQQGVALAPYNECFSYLSTIRQGVMRMNPQLTVACREACQRGGQALVCGPSPVVRLRMIKTPAEQEGFRRAMERDGVAMVRFLMWLEQHRADGITEMDVDNYLTQQRARMPRFRGLSFATIAAYGPHGAIVHYEAEPATAATLEPRGLLLLDSGAQYDDGTTDITRTIALGPTTAEERLCYTLVLKAHLALQAAVFPTGTTGLALDAICRRPLWQHGYDYGHGTGHGVGTCLCVHEGPAQIRKNSVPSTAIGYCAGMMVTDEPGIYEAGKFGVRIENTLLCVDGPTTPFGRYSRFEPLTLCPYDLEPLDRTLLTAKEVEHINAYHQLVRTRLLPHLADERERRWLMQHTEPLAKV